MPVLVCEKCLCVFSRTVSVVVCPICNYEAVFRQATDEEMRRFEADKRKLQRADAEESLIDIG